MAARQDVDPFKGDVWLSFHWHIKNAARDPLDNLQACAKPILDALVRLEIIEDDSTRFIQSPSLIFWTVNPDLEHEILYLSISDEPIQYDRGGIIQGGDPAEPDAQIREQ